MNCNKMTPKGTPCASPLSSRILQYLLSNEKRSTSKTNYLEHIQNGEITASDRENIICQIFEIADSLQISMVTKHITVVCLDSVLSHIKIPINELFYYAFISLHLASKYEGDKVDEVKELREKLRMEGESGGGFQEIEREILESTGWNISFPTAPELLLRLIQHTIPKSYSHSAIINHAYNILSLCFTEYSLSGFNASVLAIASLLSTFELRSLKELRQMWVGLLLNEFIDSYIQQVYYCKQKLSEIIISSYNNPNNTNYSSDSDTKQSIDEEKENKPPTISVLSNKMGSSWEFDEHNKSRMTWNLRTHSRENSEDKCKEEKGISNYPHPIKSQFNNSGVCSRRGSRNTRNKKAWDMNMGVNVDINNTKNINNIKNMEYPDIEIEEISSPSPSPSPSSSSSSEMFSVSEEQCAQEPRSMHEYIYMGSIPPPRRGKTELAPRHHSHAVSYNHIQIPPKLLDSFIDTCDISNHDISSFISISPKLQNSSKPPSFPTSINLLFPKHSFITNSTLGGGDDVLGDVVGDVLGDVLGGILGCSEILTNSSLILQTRGLARVRPFSCDLLDHSDGNMNREGENEVNKEYVCITPEQRDGHPTPRESERNVLGNTQLLKRSVSLFNPRELRGMKGLGLQSTNNIIPNLCPQPTPSHNREEDTSRLTNYNLYTLEDVYREYDQSFEHDYPLTYLF